VSQHDPYRVSPQAPPPAPGRPPGYGQAPAYGQPPTPPGPAPAYGQYASPSGPAPAYGQHASGPAPAHGRYGAPPPGGGYGPPPRVPGGLATATIVLAAAVTAVQLLSWLTSFGAAAEYARAERLGVPPVEVLTAYDGVTLLLLPVQLAAAVVTCLWLWQSRALAEVLTPGSYHARGRVWVWLGWIVPVVAYWFPYQVVRDVRAATVRDRRPGLGWWWTGWLVFTVATNVAGQVSTRGYGSSGEVFSVLPVAETLGTAGAVLALVLWIRTVREITAGQRAALTPAAW
jgi:hypothetical protein